MDTRSVLQLFAVLTVCTLGSASARAEDGYASLNGGTRGGDGGEVVNAATGTEIHEALCNRPASDSPLTIYVEGTINHANTSGVSGDSCNAGSGDDRIEIKDVSNVSIIGMGAGAVFDQIGIHVRGSSNIILQNLHVRNVKKSGSPTSNGGDAIGMESDVYNVWVDHCTLEASGGEDEGYDGLFDLKSTVQYVTLSYSILRNSGRGGLVGSSDGDDTNGPVTYHHNLFENIDSRVPLLRHGTAHAYNNHYDGIHKSGMNPRIGGQIKAENNFFENAKDPLGTFYTNEPGYWDVSGNVFTPTVTWSDEGDENYPAGPDLVSTTSIRIDYSYTLDPADCVPQVVAATAGAHNGLARSDGSCSEGQDPDPVDAGTSDAGSQSPSSDAGPAPDAAAAPDASDTAGDAGPPPSVEEPVDAGGHEPGADPTAPANPTPTTPEPTTGTADPGNPGAPVASGSSGCAVGAAGRPTSGRPSLLLAGGAAFLVTLVIRRRRPEGSGRSSAQT